MKTVILMLAVLAFFIAGCGTTRAPLRGKSDPYRSGQIQYVDPSLQSQTRIGEVGVDRDQAGILLVTVQIRNVSSSTFPVDWRITFLDRNGRPLSNTGWTPKTFNANTFEHLTANSLSADADDFQIELRYAQ